MGLGACGGDEGTAESPGLPKELALQLAGQSEAVATSLAAGDACLAAAEAKLLRDSVDSAIAGGQVPEALQGELQTGADNVASGIECTPAPAPTVPTTSTPTTTGPPDCETLTQQLDQLEEQSKGLDHDAKKQLDEQRKQLEELAKQICEEGDEGGSRENGPGNSENAPGHNKGGD